MFNANGTAYAGPVNPAPSGRFVYLVQRQTASPKSIGFPPKPAPIS
jgi:hypothetical protein